MGRHISAGVLACTAAAACAFVAPPVWGGPAPTPIALTGQQAPGGTLPFVNFQSLQDPTLPTLIPPAVDGGNIVFGARTAAGVGLYLWQDGSLSVVADHNTQVPQAHVTFNQFDSPTISGSDIAFRGSGTDVGGIYARLAGALVRVADGTITPPGQAGTFDTLAFPSITSSNVFFAGEGSGPNSTGVYQYKGGVLSTVADQTTPIPGSTGAFKPLQLVTAEGGRVAFYGFDTVGTAAGIYSLTGTGLTRLVHTGTTVAGGTDTITFIDNGSLGFDGTTVGFDADTQTSNILDNVFGVYTATNGVVRRVARSGDPAPGGGTYNFQYLNTSVSVGDGHVAFTDGNHVLYSDVGGTLERIVGPGDILNGEDVSAVYMSRQALSGDELVFAVQFTDGKSGIFAVPEPACASFAPLLVLLVRKRGSGN